MKEDLLKGLTEEQKKKVAECNSPKEILDLAKEEGIALTDEQLEAVSGGHCWGDGKPVGEPMKCPKCGSTQVTFASYRGAKLMCKDCCHTWYG